jgi:uncharacterized membrane protein YfcA
MDLLNHVDPLYSASGFGVGLLVGLTGVGGGSLMTPLLVLLFGIHPATAVGTDLLFASATKCVGTLVHGSRATVDWRITGRLALGSIPATALTILLLQRLGSPDEVTARLISITLGVALLLTGLSLFARKWLLGFAARHAVAPAPRQAALLTIATGALLGVLVSLTSVGAGAIGATVLLLLYPRLPAARIVGSDIAHAVPLTLLAGVGHWLIGSVDWGLFGSLLAGSVPGIVLGSFVVTSVPEFLLRPTLGAMLLIAGSRMVV